MKKKLSFNVNAYTARLIGRENVSTLDGAILELVKNTYDADATKCILYYEQSTNSLYLIDNGSGMTEEIIEKHWMTIGNSSKDRKFITSNGRIQTGAKGIGRFALDRIGDICTMHTKNRYDNYVIEWIVDWRNFKREETLTNVTAEISYLNSKYLELVLDNIKNEEIKKFILNNNFNTGTVFRIENLREEWNDDLISKIKNSLSSLLPPEIEEEFSIYFFKESNTVKDAIIKSKGIEEYDYKIEFEVKANNVQIVINRNEFDFKDKFNDIMQKTKFTKKDENYFKGESIVKNKSIFELVSENISKNIGDFSGRLYFFKKNFNKKDQEKYYYKDIMGRQDYSEVFGGIKLYRDNFRVRPYGEKDSSNYDWLLLGNRRGKSPAAISHLQGRWRVGVEQICGIVNISRMNLYLPDQSNREGIIETKEFTGLKEIIRAIIDEFESDRQYVGRELNKYYEATHKFVKTEIEKEVEEKASKEEANKVNTKDTMISATRVKSLMESDKETIENLENENCMLRNLATTGIVTNQYIHETKGNVNNIGLNISTAKDALIFKNDIERAISNLKKAEEYVETLNSWFDVTIDSIKRDKRNMKFIDLKVLVNNQIKKWIVALKNQNIDINLEIEEIEEFKCFPYEIESIISNLIANSVVAFRGIENKLIEIIIKKVEGGLKIIYRDNGNGLSVKYKNNPRKILEPFETDRTNSQNELVGTGMGMWIVNTIVKSYNGNINLDRNINLEKGFYIEIDLYGNFK